MKAKITTNDLYGVTSDYDSNLVDKVIQAEADLQYGGSTTVDKETYNCLVNKRNYKFTYEKHYSNKDSVEVSIVPNIVLTLNNRN